VEINDSAFQDSTVNSNGMNSNINRNNNNHGSNGNDHNSENDNGNNNNNASEEDIAVSSRNQCSRCELRMDSSEALPILGRKQPINIVTIFAKGDDKRHLLACPDLITIHDLNPRLDLLEQWDRLRLPPQGPDLIVAKLHKALGSKHLKPTAAAIVKNYETLRERHWNLFQRLELVPLETEILLTNRFMMQDLIDKVCNAVNLTLDNSEQKAYPRKSSQLSPHPPRPAYAHSKGHSARKQLSEILCASKLIRSFHGQSGSFSSGIDVKGSLGSTTAGSGSSSGNSASSSIASAVAPGAEQRSFCSKPKSVQMRISQTNSTATSAAASTTSTTNGSASASTSSTGSNTAVDDDASCSSVSISAVSSSSIFSSTRITTSCNNAADAEAASAAPSNGSPSLSTIVDGKLPPFPLVVKSASTSTKGMAMVLDEVSLRHFASRIEGGGVVIEQFVQHDNAILKMYVIGKEIYVVRRRSLPNVTSSSESAVRQFASDVGGEFVPLEESQVGGYAVYQSDQMPKTNHGVTLLEECDDLDGAVLRLLTQALARELRVDLFGFDVLVESQTNNIFVVDVNVLPGFKGVPSSQRRLCAWLSFLATRRAFKEDCLSLSPQDLLRLSLSRHDEEPRVNLETLRVTQITRNRIFEVKFKEKLDSPGARTRHTLVKFRPVQTPRRFVEDRDHFVSNLARELATRGLGPPFIKDVSAVYFDRRRHLGVVREWVEGTPLYSHLAAFPAAAAGASVVTDAATASASSSSSSGRLSAASDEFNRLLLPPFFGAVFRGVGFSLAKFHSLSNDAEFRRGVVDKHFPGNLATPVVFRLLEQWRRDAVLSLLCARSALEESSEASSSSSSAASSGGIWSSLCSGVIGVSRDLEGIIDVIVERITTPEAAKTVFGHFDANTNNIIVCSENHRGFEEEEWKEKAKDKNKQAPSSRRKRNGDKEEQTVNEDGDAIADVFLIDEEWASPNVAIYDFAKFVTSVSMMQMRGQTKLTEGQLRRGVTLMAESYLKTMTAEEDEEKKRMGREEEEEDVTREKVEDFVNDVWTFVPVAALTNCFSNLIHATKESQLSGFVGEIPASDDLIQPDGSFNWLRHARDHFQIFQTHFQRLIS